MFPARAGMSREESVNRLNHSGVPRASGDEPNTMAKVFHPNECSPRERG